MTVYVVDGGDYDNYGWDGVYASLEDAIAAHPIPHMRAIPYVQCDPTPHLKRPGGWMPHDDTNPREIREWWNGFDGDFGKHIHEVTVRGYQP